MTTLQIAVDDDDIARLTVRAEKLGKPVDLLLRELIHDYARPTSFAEAFKPLQDAMAGHGMTEEESLAFWEAERAAMWAEREVEWNMRRDAATRSAGPQGPSDGTET